MLDLHELIDEAQRRHIDISAFCRSEIAETDIAETPYRYDAGIIVGMSFNRHNV